ncbi:MAG: 4Fe-4S dicluster domain-containing protein [Chloroflexi bacterium]|nr:4Fe-4S dicluster domain-containing protein [Chloroflexota bacterium]
MDKTINRRDFLKIAAAGTAAIAGAQIIQSAEASSGGEKGPHQWAMVIDQSKCIGCGHCTLACQAHNDISPEISWNEVLPAGEVDNNPVYLARPCMQCENAPCVEVCMVGASYYRPDGIVMMDYDKCIGCRYCEVACPYQARSFNWSTFDGDNPAVPEWGQPEVDRRPRGVPEKCSFCYQRIDRGMAVGLIPGVDDDASPACTVACPTNARIFGDLNDPESEVSKIVRSQPTVRLRDELGTAPRVYYVLATPDDFAETTS